MGLNNLNVYQKPAVSIASMCLARLDHGELDMDITSRDKNKRSREWVDLDSNPLNDKEMQKLTGLTQVGLLGLWRKHKGDCLKIIKNHGYGLARRGGRSPTKYLDRNGDKVGQKAISKQTGLSREKIRAIFSSVRFDYVEAYKIIDRELAL